MIAAPKIAQMTPQTTSLPGAQKRIRVETGFSIAPSAAHPARVRRYCAERSSDRSPSAWSCEKLAEEERRTLWADAFSIVSRRSFSEWCSKTGRVCRTVYRHMHHALEGLSINLSKCNIFLRLPDLERCHNSPDLMLPMRQGWKALREQRRQLRASGRHAQRLRLVNNKQPERF